ncbi:MAG: M28 family peptidase [Verrucomicrobiota bacterium]
MSKFRYSYIPLAVLIALVGCKRHPSGHSATGPGATASTSPPPAEIWKEFSGEKAFVATRAQCELGPRPAGSAELEKARGLITAELQRNGWSVERQTFTDSTPRGAMAFTNLIARFGGSDKTQQFIVCSHYDTKTFDTIRFVGASDGASSTGALMELSRVLAKDPALAQRVELVFFDGEEAFVQFNETDGLYGSRHYAKALRETQRNRQFKAGVLWDMIGDKDLTITLSPDSPSQLSQAIFAAADQLQARKYFSFFNRPIWDDHVPLNMAHIPTIDLIDFDYVYWHTADDTLDKLSPASLQTVGGVTLRWLKSAATAP